MVNCAPRQKFVTRGWTLIHFHFLLLIVTLALLGFSARAISKMGSDPTTMMSAKAIRLIQNKMQELYQQHMYGKAIDQGHDQIEGYKREWKISENQPLSGNKTLTIKILWSLPNGGTPKSLQHQVVLPTHP